MTRICSDGVLTVEAPIGGGEAPLQHDIAPLTRDKLVDG
jgi:hypothetical protein